MVGELWADHVEQDGVAAVAALGPQALHGQDRSQRLASGVIGGGEGGGDVVGAGQNKGGGEVTADSWMRWRALVPLRGIRSILPRSTRNWMPCWLGSQRIAPASASAMRDLLQVESDPGAGSDVFKE
jgi:hypothetical protein